MARWLCALAIGWLGFVGACGGTSVEPTRPDPELVGGAGPASPTAARLAVGQGQACYAGEDEVFCWGRPEGGALGHPALALSARQVGAPVYLPEPLSLTRLASGWRFTCGLREGGDVVCFGDVPSDRRGRSEILRVAQSLREAQGQARPNGSEEPPELTVLDVLRGANHLAAHGGTLCAVLADASVRCLGAALRDPRLETSDPFPSITGAVAVAVGARHGCALLDDGRVRCWGDDRRGQLGGGHTEPTERSVDVAGLSDAGAIACGSEHCCAIRDRRARPPGGGTIGTVSCWGAGTSGQLGQGRFEDSPRPVDVEALSDATALALGDAHSCARLASGTVRCWGDGFDGQLGDGSTRYRPTPVDVVDLGNVVEIAAGADVTCAADESLAIHCWGSDTDGGLGTPGPASSPVFTAVDVADAAGVSIDASHGCAFSGSGRVWCWGNGARGRLGHGSTRSSRHPVPVEGLPPIVELTTGPTMSCARADDGRVFCWGEYIGGALRPGHATPFAHESVQPERIGGLSATAIAAGGNHACAIDDTGRVWCWGSNLDGQVDGSPSPQTVRAPVPVPTVDDAVSIAASTLQTCAALRSGAVRCWGARRRQIGAAPADVDGIADAVAVTGGGGRMCVLTREHRVRCWGSYVEGIRTVPLADVRAVECDRGACCAIAEAALYCWGGAQGLTPQEAMDFSRDPDAPTRLPADAPDAIGVAGAAVCWIERAGPLRCTGDHNRDGQLGAVTDEIEPRPVRVAEPEHPRPR